MHTAIVYICVLFAENEMEIVKGVALWMLEKSYTEFSFINTKINVLNFF
jgi:hypothetical protein